MDLQALFPVYLPKARRDESEDDYNDAVSLNDNNLNQNLEILFNAVQTLASVVERSVPEEDKSATGGGETPSSPGAAELLPATADMLGGIKVGSNLTIDANGVLSVDTATAVEADNTRPVTSAAVHVEIGNIEALLQNI